MKTAFDWIIVGFFVAFLVMMSIRIFLDWRQMNDMRRTMYQAKARAVEEGMVQVIMPQDVKRALMSMLHAQTPYTLEPFAASPGRGDIPMWIVMRRPEVRVSER